MQRLLTKRWKKNKPVQVEQKENGLVFFGELKKKFHLERVLDDLRGKKRCNKMSIRRYLNKYLQDKGIGNGR